jgi:hypothetical protein
VADEVDEPQTIAALVVARGDALPMGLARVLVDAAEGLQGGIGRTLPSRFGQRFAELDRFAGVQLPHLGFDEGFEGLAVADPVDHEVGAKFRAVKTNCHDRLTGYIVWAGSQ